MNLPKAHSDTYGYGPRQQMAYALWWGEWCNNHVLEKNETTSVVSYAIYQDLVGWMPDGHEVDSANSSVKIAMVGTSDEHNYALYWSLSMEPWLNIERRVYEHPIEIYFALWSIKIGLLHAEIWQIGKSNVK